MKQKLIDVLEEICPNNVFLQGTFNEEDEYPKGFITFFTNYTDDHSHFDNDLNAENWSFSVIYYSNDPSDIETKPKEIRKALKDAGFIPQGKGNDIASDVQSHTGWAMDFIITEYE